MITSAAYSQPAVRYDAGNAAEVIGLCMAYPTPNATLTHSIDANGTIKFTMTNIYDVQEVFVRVGEWVLPDVFGGFVPVVLTPERFAAYYMTPERVVDSNPCRAALAVASRAGGGAGVSGPIPALLGNATTTLRVTLRPTMPSTAAYDVNAFIVGSSTSLLASLSVQSVTKIAEADGTSKFVDVVVRNTGLVTLTAGAQVLVHTV